MRVRGNHTRLGLSTVVTGAILLTAVAVMGTGLVSWANTNLRSHQQSLESTYSTNVNKLSENLIIENVWFGSNPSKFVNITMNNVGSVGLNVTKIQFINPSNNIKLAEFTIFKDQRIFQKQSNSTVIYYSWTSNAPIDIAITTARGSIYKTQVMPP